jgi:RNA polymerase sigma-B factor
VPRRLKEIAAKVQEVRDSLSTELARTPTVAEIAERADFTEEQIIEAMESSHAYGTYSLDKTFEDAGENGESAFLERYTGFEEKGFVQIENDEIIRKVLDELNERDQYIFRERFLNERSQSDIAGSLGVSQMTISRAERSIVEKFRAELNK